MDYSKGTNKIHYIDETLGVVGATLEGMDCHIL